MSSGLLQCQPGDKSIAESALQTGLGVYKTWTFTRSLKEKLLVALWEL